MYVCMYHELYKLISPLSAWMFTPDKDKNRVLWHMLLYCDVFYREFEYFGIKDIIGGIKSDGKPGGGAGQIAGNPWWFPEPRNPVFAKLSKSLHICRVSEYHFCTKVLFLQKSA